MSIKWEKGPLVVLRIPGIYCTDFKMLVIQSLISSFGHGRMVDTATRLDTEEVKYINF